jgi:hypothetical protein
MSHLDLVADLDTPAAPNALVRVVLQSKILACVIADGLRYGRPSEHLLAELIFVSIPLENAVPIFVARGASAFMLAEEQLEDGLANRPNLVRIGPDYRSIPGLGSAGRLQPPLALDFDEAQAARPGRPQPRIVTEIGNLNAVGQSGLEYGLSLPGCNLLTVYC